MTPAQRSATPRRPDPARSRDPRTQPDPRRVRRVRRNHHPRTSGHGHAQPPPPATARSPAPIPTESARPPSGYWNESSPSRPRSARAADGHAECRNSTISCDRDAAELGRTHRHGTTNRPCRNPAVRRSDRHHPEDRPSIRRRATARRAPPARSAHRGTAATTGSADRTTARWPPSSPTPTPSPAGNPSTAERSPPPGGTTGKPATPPAPPSPLPCSPTPSPSKPSCSPTSAARPTPPSSPAKPAPSPPAAHRCCGPGSPPPTAKPSPPTGQPDASLRTFDTAHDLLPAQPDRLADGPYLALDDVHLARWRGHALAHFGHPDATTVLRRRLGRHDAEFTRAEAGLRTDLVLAHLAGRRTRRGTPGTGRRPADRQCRRVSSTTGPTLWRRSRYRLVRLPSSGMADDVAPAVLRA